jgi:hypothetical protein
VPGAEVAVCGAKLLIELLREGVALLIVESL